MSSESALPTDFFDGDEGVAIRSQTDAEGVHRNESLDEFFAEVGAAVQPRTVSDEMEDRKDGEQEDDEETAAQYSYLIRVAGLMQKKGRLDGESTKLRISPERETILVKIVNSSSKRKETEGTTATTAADLLCFSF